MFEHVIQALVHGSGYERVSSPNCSDPTIRRRVRFWAGMGVAQELHRIALEAYDRMIGLDLGEISESTSAEPSCSWSLKALAMTDL
ncbi:hypothetical protein J7I97_33690 [Streptomyces sp. ISL-87]|nr:hypothetical protein [Streptomyces sp. ISL-21]MBT2613034.1 hypothetical protein [Streptomyces sp. ISL-87]